MPDSPSSKTESSLLIAAPEAWRQMCFSMPAVRALQAEFDEVQILCPEPQRQFWSGLGFMDPITYPPGAGARQIAPLLKGIPRVLLWEAGLAADACAKAGIPERVGLPAPKLVRRLTKELSLKIRPGPQEHEVRRYLDTAELLGARPFESQHFAPIDTGAARDENSVLVIPGSDFGTNHEWPLERWAKVVAWIKEFQLPIKIGLAGNKGLGRELAEMTESEGIPLDPANPGPLSTFGLCLAADGSMPHLAAALGTTCAVLFGPADPELVRPLGRHHLVIRRKVECAPCFVENCPMDLRCQNDLSVERVLSMLTVFSGEG